MLNVIKFIKENSFEKLKEEFGISINQDALVSPNLVSLNYDQIASPKSHPIVQECRGLVINKDTLEVVARSFDRFYNYGEVPEQTKKVDFSRATIFEKVDGSLINWYYNKEQSRWVFASRGNPTGRSAITKSRHSYHHLMCLALGIDVSDINPLVSEDDNWLDLERYNEYLNRINEVVSDVLVKEYTYITELVSPHINIVTQYSATNAYLLGVRETSTGFYNDNIVVPFFSLPIVYNATSVEGVMEVISMLSKGSDILREGVVVYDPINGIRTKIKNSVYIKAHRNLGKEIDEKSILELVAANEEAEYLTYFSNDTPLFENYIGARTKVVNGLNVLIQKANECVANGDTINEIAKWLKAETNSEFVFPAIKKNLTTGLQVFSQASESARIRAIKSAK